MRTKGYTLLELLVVITITGLIFGIGFLSFRDFNRRQALASTNRQIIADLRLAKEQALAGKKPASCVGVLDGYLFTVASPTTYTIAASCENGVHQIKSVTLPTDFELEALGTNPVLFKVIGHGTDLTVPAEITLTQVSTEKESPVIISTSGEIN